MFYRPQGLFGYMEITSMKPLNRIFRRPEKKEGGRTDG
jgi:branched-chain amino acid transport system permease protein